MRWRKSIFIEPSNCSDPFLDSAPAAANFSRRLINRPSECCAPDSTRKSRNSRTCCSGIYCNGRGRRVRGLKTAREFTELFEEIPRILTEIGEASKTATEAQKVDLEFLARRIAERFSNASEMADTDGDDVALHRMNEAVESAPKSL